MGTSFGQKWGYSQLMLQLLSELLAAIMGNSNKQSKLQVSDYTGKSLNRGAERNVDEKVLVCSSTFRS